MAEYQTSRWRPALVLLGDMTLPSIAWGMNTLLFVQCVNTLRKKIRRKPSEKHPKIMMALIALLYILCLAQLVAITMAKAEQQNPSVAVFASIDWEKSKCAGVKAGVNLAYLLTTLLTDGILLWRCWILYTIQSSAVTKWGVRGFLVLVFMGVIGTGVAHIVQELDSPGGLTISYFFIATLALNATFNLLLVARLLFHRRQVKKLIGPGFGGRYISIVAMIIESAIASIVFMIPAVIFPFTLGALFFGVPLLAQTQTLATFLVIYRVAQDKAWNNQGSTHVSNNSLQFTVSTRMASTLGGTTRSFSTKRRSAEYDLESEGHIP